MNFTKPMTSATSLARQSIRYASYATKENMNKISVQLLKDHPKLGVQGQVVSVKPAFMRIDLHPKKYAVYMVDGPTIPVVEKPVQHREPKKTKKKVVKTEKKELGSLSTTELSDLFSSLKTSKKNVETNQIKVDDSKEAITYTASEIREYIPAVNTINAENFPISKTYLSEYAYNVSGLTIPITALRVLNSANKVVDTIEEKGEYSWLIDTPERKEVKVTLTIQ